MKSIRLTLSICIFSILAMTLSCSNDNSTSPPPTNTVIIRDNLYDPAMLTVNVGRAVVWRHEGSNQHTVTSGSPTVQPGALFDSGPLTNGGGFQFTFSAPGTFPYFCRIHGVAHTGTITVR